MSADLVTMKFVRSVGKRIQWECPECGHRTMTAKEILPLCTACWSPENEYMEPPGWTPEGRE